LTLSGGDYGVSRRSSPAAHARAPGPYADAYVVAVNLVVVESDGSRPGRPNGLRGGEQARRHRAACIRGHGLLRGCVELKWRWLRSDQRKHYRASSTFGQITSDHGCDMERGRARPAPLSCGSQYEHGSVDGTRHRHRRRDRGCDRQHGRMRRVWGCDRTGDRGCGEPRWPKERH
jgi:hypothetical protein